MESTKLMSVINSEVDSKVARFNCRCCFSSNKRVLNASKYQEYFMELTGISVKHSNEEPQWICYECGARLQKAVHFRRQIINAHKIMCDYIETCTPLPVEVSSPLCTTKVLRFSVCTKKSGYQKVLTHTNRPQQSEVKLDPPRIAFNTNPFIKQEIWTDYEADVTLRQESVLYSESHDAKETQGLISPRTSTKCKNLPRNVDNDDSEENLSGPDNPRRDPKTDPKTVELDPDKIRIIILSEDDQLKQREEDKITGLKFPFQCMLCYKGYNYESTLSRHMEKHDPCHGRFKCEVCHVYFPTPYTYGLHAHMHGRRYECVRCGRRMIDRASILEHYRTQHEGVTYICNVCKKVFSNFKTHQGHMRNHHRGTRPQCGECGKSFLNKNSLTEHKRIHEGVKSFECAPCNLKFRTISQLRQHRSNHHSDNTKATQDFYCVECDERFKTIHNLRKHLQKSLKHQDENNFKFPCAQCPRRFASPAQWRAHAQVQHEGVRAHRCHTCGAGLASRSSLHKHQLTVHGGRRPSRGHVCDTCGRAFRSKNVLVNHVRTHTGEKPFACTECGRSFAQRTTMQTHYKLVHLKLRRKQKVKPESGPVIEQAKIDVAK